MKLLQLGGTDLKVSEIGLGTQNWGEQNDERQAHAQLEWALEHGINFIDTAELYPAPNRRETQGLSERIIGAWLAANPTRRDKFVIATKMKGPGHVDWVRADDDHVSPAAIRAAIDGSLQRLGTDRIDLFQIHWPDRYVPNFGQWQFDVTEDRTTVSIMEQIEAMTAAIREGKIRAYGLSNESCFGVCEFSRVAREHGLAAPASVQNVYNLVSRTFDGELAEACHRLPMPLIAYGVLAKGMLSGKFRAGERPAESRLVKYPRPGERYERPRVVAAAEQYAAIAERHGMTPAGLALAFVRSRFFVASTLIGGTSVEQLDQLAAYFDVTLSKEVLAEIEAVHAACPSPAAQ